MHFLEKLQRYLEEGYLPERLKINLENFYPAYMKAVSSLGNDLEPLESFFDLFIDRIKDQYLHPYSFEPYHQRIVKPFDYYEFGLDFLRPIVDMKTSTVKGRDQLAHIDAQLKAGHNIIFLANHQTEGDPQAISLLLEDSYPHIGAEMIFVAGERVTSDPLAAPFSMGRNLLCIYSKRHIDNIPEQKEQKQQHNKRTMQRMAELLSEGGHCIYVAPSGGRDRPNAQGVVEVAPFDPQSVEMFRLMASRASKPSHFYPLALVTYNVLPPPNTVEKELGEQRIVQGSSIHAAFGKELDMEHFPGSDLADKHQRREALAHFVWETVKKDYDSLKIT